MNSAVQTQFAAASSLKFQRFAELHRSKLGGRHLSIEFWPRAGLLTEECFY
jgi:hypothetical protein